MTFMRQALGSCLARRWARRWLAPGRAVILDTETTDLGGQVIELAVVDAHSGDTLLDTLIRPAVSIAGAATRVHGITDAMCSDAPTWTEVWPHIHPVLEGRIALAYNAPYDRDVILSECARSAVAAPRLHWGCVMRLDALARGTRRWRRLDGGHRALGDSRAARSVLVSIAEEGGVWNEQPQAAHLQ